LVILDMQVNDSIASLLTTIRTGQKLQKLYVIHYSSKLLCQILDVLVREGYLLGYSSFYSIHSSQKKFIKIFLKYTITGLPVIKSIIRVSKASQKLYFNKLNQKKKDSLLGIYIIATSKGILSDQEARKLNIGGEILCKIF